MYAARIKNILWKNISISGLEDCWLWTKSTTGGGYGCFNTGKRYGLPTYAHRAVYLICKGELIAGMYICHTCDNPRCCNPIHLFQGTPADNAIDMYIKGRGKVPARGLPKQSSTQSSKRRNRLTTDEIARVLLQNESSELLATTFKVTRSCITKIRLKFRHLHSDAVTL